MTRKYSFLLYIVLIGLLLTGCMGNIKKDNAVQYKQEEKAEDNKISEDKEKGLTVSNKPENTKVIYNDTSIPVLMYHSIAYEKGNDLRVPVEKFREQMKYLKDKNYTTLTFDEFYNFLTSNTPVPEKSVVITFDDGYEDNYTNAYPVMKEFGLKGTVFVITNTIDKDSSYVTSKQIQEMDENGMTFESHTLNHDDLIKLSYDKQLETLKESKLQLEQILNRKMKYFAYPFGHFDSDVQKALEEAGYIMSFTTEGGWANRSNGLLSLKRIYIMASADINEFERRLTNPNYNMN